MKKAICLLSIVVLSIILCTCGIKPMIDYTQGVLQEVQGTEQEQQDIASSLSYSNAQIEKKNEVGMAESTSAVSTHAGNKMGDVNCDGKINYNDAILVLRSSVGLSTIDLDMIPYADVDQNGKINYSDAIKILRVSVGLEELQSPATEPTETEPTETKPTETEPTETEPTETEPPATGSNGALEGDANVGGSGEIEW